MNVRHLACVALPFAAAAGAAETENPLRVENLWIREAPPVARVLAAYGRFCNDGAETVSIASVSSTVFERIEMHETVETGGRVSMRRLESVTVGPEECLDFVPGGRHFMLFGPEHPLRAGSEVALTFVFATGQEQAVTVPVRRQQNDNSHGHHAHEH
jgi:copper(I)-binding protein